MNRAAADRISLALVVAKKIVYQRLVTGAADSNRMNLLSRGRNGNSKDSESCGSNESKLGEHLLKRGGFGEQVA